MASKVVGLVKMVVHDLSVIKNKLKDDMILANRHLVLMWDKSYIKNTAEILTFWHDTHTGKHLVLITKTSVLYPANEEQYAFERSTWSWPVSLQALMVLISCSKVYVIKTRSMKSRLWYSAQAYRAKVLYPVSHMHRKTWYGPVYYIHGLDCWSILAKVWMALWKVY